VVALLLAGCSRLAAPVAEEPDPDQGQVLAAVPPSELAATATLEPACPPVDPAELLTADDFNETFQDLDLPYWQQSDVGASAVLSDGRVLWVWGDTVRDSDVQPRMTDNSILVTSGTCVSQLLTTVHGPVLPLDPNRLSIWPLSVVRLDPRPDDAADVTDVVVVFCSRVQRGDRMWDFLERGTTVGVYTVGADGVPRLADAAQLTPDDPDVGAIHWGAASTLDGDWVYLYGTRSTGQAYTYGRELFVSRIPAADVMDGSSIEYWDGTTWQADSSHSAPIMGAVDGVSERLSVDVIDGRWVAFSKLGGDFADVAAVWTSDSPVGPFTAQPVLDAPAGLDIGRLQYMPMAHPDIPTDPGSMIVSVSRNVTDFQLLLRQPRLGRPLFAEVPRP
jgi:hypothetical protein